LADNLPVRFDDNGNPFSHARFMSCRIMVENHLKMKQKIANQAKMFSSNA